PAEVRYIPAEAVRPSAAPQEFGAAAPEPVKPASAPPSAAPTSASPQPVVASSTAVTPTTIPATASSPPTPSSSTNPLWLQADEAERAGDIVRAQELLKELAVQDMQTDYPLAVRCLNRIETLRDRSRNGFTAQAPTNTPATANARGGA